MIHLTPTALADQVKERLAFYEATDMDLSVEVMPDLEVRIAHPLVEVRLQGVPEFANARELTHAIDSTILHLAQALKAKHDCPMENHHADPPVHGVRPRRRRVGPPTGPDAQPVPSGDLRHPGDHPPGGGVPGVRGEHPAAALSGAAWGEAVAAVAGCPGRPPAAVIEALIEAGDGLVRQLGAAIASARAAHARCLRLERRIDRMTARTARTGTTLAEIFGREADPESLP